MCPPSTSATRHGAEGGQDVVLEGAAVDACGMGAAVLCDVAAHVPPGEIEDGEVGLRHGRCRVLALLDAVDDGGGALSGLVRGDVAVLSESDALGR